ncbi:hypothetical protein [Actinoplanes sp. NPDC051859]|uniref:hypothetical protein n=1 Tax=Actinoplanes sp. NPDC051859 TaxID=3363909 RepID=UPI0037AC4EFF
MQPRPPKPQPHFLEQDLAGMPIWGHLLLGVGTVGLWFLILPFYLLYVAVQAAFAQVVAAAILLPAKAVVRLLRGPVRALLRASGRQR